MLYNRNKRENTQNDLFDIKSDIDFFDSLNAFMVMLKNINTSFEINSK